MNPTQPAVAPRPWSFWGTAGNSSWYLSEKLLRLAGAFLVSAWVARYLGPQQYGTLAFGVGLVAMAGFLGSLGLESVVVRDLVQHPERESRIASSYFMVRLCGGVLVPLIACAYVAITDPANRDLLLIAGILGTGVLFSSFEVVDCVLQARHAARSSSLIHVAGFVAGVLAKVCLVLAGAPLVAFAMATIIEPIVVAGLLWATLRRHGLTMSPRLLDWDEVRSLLLGGRMLILSGLTIIIYSKIDLLVVGELISKEVLGSYAIAAAMCGAWNTVGTSIAQAYAPHISASRTSDVLAYTTILRRFLFLMLGMSIAGSVLLSLLSPWIFDLLLGPAYAQGAGLFSLLVWSSVPAFLGVATSQIIVNERLYGLSLLRTGLGMLAMLGLVFPAARAYGAMGVSAAVVASATVATVSLLLSGEARSVLGRVFVRGGR